MPADRTCWRTRSSKLHEQDEVVERVDERQPAHLLRRDLGTAQVLLRDCTARSVRAPILTTSSGSFVLGPDG